MLTDNQLKDTIDDIVSLYQEIEDEVIKKLVGFIDNNEELGGSAKWYTKKLDELSDLNGDLVRTLAKYSIKTEKVIRSMLEKASFANFSEDGVIGITKEKLLENARIRDQIDYFANDLGRNMAKIRTNTINLTKKEYLKIVDKATLETSLGVKSFSQSIDDSLKELGEKGISGQVYERPDGTLVNYSIEGLVRRDATTSVFGIANRAMLEMAKDTGNLVYVSQHLGARTHPFNKVANHAGWQGKIYMLEGSSEKYGNFYDETGAGTVEGFGGVNCRHRVVSAYEGMKIPEELDLEKNAEVEKLKKHQRYLERGVRAWKRKELIFKTSGNEEEYKKAHFKVKEWSDKLDQFTKDNDLRRDYIRERVANTTNANSKNYGAWNDKNDQNFEQRDRIGKELYEQITKRKKEYEIINVSKNSGFSRKDVETIYNHIFVQEHLFEGNIIKKFDPDYYMAHSWNRIREGKKIYPHDLTMLHHELKEALIFKENPGITYEKAHEIASQSYNYTKDLLKHLKDNDV